MMKSTYECNGQAVRANNYAEAADKLLGVIPEGATGEHHAPLRYIRLHHDGSATVETYKPGDKIGTYWGVQAARPQRDRITRH